MASFQKTFKKIYSADAAGTSGITVDNLLESGSLYMVVGYNWEYASSPNHLYFYLRGNNNDYVGGAYMRQDQVLQHGLGNIVFDNNNTSTNGGTIMYVGDQPEESGGFKMIIQNRGYEGWSNYYTDAIGHVNNTGYRGQKSSAYVQTHYNWNGFSIKTSTAGNFTSGNIDIYKINTHEWDI